MSETNWLYLQVERLAATGLAPCEIADQLGMTRKQVAKRLRFARDRREADALGVGVRALRLRRQEESDSE